MAVISEDYIYTKEQVKVTTVAEMCIQPRSRRDNERWATFQFREPRINCTRFSFPILSPKRRWRGQHKWMVYGSNEQPI